MKLQFTLFAALSFTTFCYSKNLPVPKLKNKTKQNLNKLAKNTGDKIDAAFNKVGLNVDPKKLGLDNYKNAAKPQIDAIEKEANKAYESFSSKFGNWNLGQLADTVLNDVNGVIEKAEGKAPDGAKPFIDIGQNILVALTDAGKDSLGDNQKLTVNKIISGGATAVEKAMNGKAANSALKTANKAVREQKIGN